MKNTDLLPCPFCGEYPILREDGGDWFVNCVNGDCACIPRTLYYSTKEEAIEAWNRREGAEQE